MQWSHSKVELFEKCKFKYKMRYLEGIKTIDPINADNALVVGTALHTGIETNVENAIHEYMMSYPIIDNSHVNEVIKLEHLIPKAKEMLPEGFYEVEILDDDFHGFIDLLAPVRLFHDSEVPDVYDIYDFKYSNNENHYKESRQLHLYKYFFEKCNPGKKIRNLNFLFVPKVNIKQKKTGDLQQFRERLNDELKDSKPSILQCEYEPNKVIDFLLEVNHIHETTEFEKEPGWYCRYCEYEEYCMKGNDYMLLPKNERRNIEKVDKRVIWIYGVPFCGKTTFANDFPEPLMLNTDGNIKFVDAPYIRIKDEIKVEGRMTKKTLAWQIFKDVISELEKKDNTFKSIIVDLAEDLYEYCRLFMYNEMGIKHESDDSFKAWDMIRGEYLNTLKRLMALDYENIILISHEDTSKDITKKGGDKITAIKPNMQDKVALKVAGMVDIVARIVADGDIRTFNFKSNEVIFGGGRLKTNAKDIPLDVDELFKVYDEANKNAQDKPSEVKKVNLSTKDETPSESENAPSESKRTSRRKKVEVAEEVAKVDDMIESAESVEIVDSETTENDAPVQDAEPTEPAEDKPRTRKSRKSVN